MGAVEDAGTPSPRDAAELLEQHVEVTVDETDPSITRHLSRTISRKWIEVAQECAINKQATATADPTQEVPKEEAEAQPQQHETGNGGDGDALRQRMDTEALLLEMNVTEVTEVVKKCSSLSKSKRRSMRRSGKTDAGEKRVKRKEKRAKREHSGKQDDSVERTQGDEMSAEPCEADAVVAEAADSEESGECEANSAGDTEQRKEFVASSASVARETRVEDSEFLTSKEEELDVPHAPPRSNTTGDVPSIAPSSNTTADLPSPASSTAVDTSPSSPRSTTTVAEDDAAARKLQASMTSPFVMRVKKAVGKSKSRGARFKGSGIGERLDPSSPQSSDGDEAVAALAVAGAGGGAAGGKNKFGSLRRKKKQKVDKKEVTARQRMEVRRMAATSTVSASPSVCRS